MLLERVTLTRHIPHLPAGLPCPAVMPAAQRRLGLSLGADYGGIYRHGCSLLCLCLSSVWQCYFPPSPFTTSGTRPPLCVRFGFAPRTGAGSLCLCCLFGMMPSPVSWGEEEEGRRIPYIALSLSIIYTQHYITFRSCSYSEQLTKVYTVFGKEQRTTTNRSRYCANLQHNVKCHGRC